MKQTQKQFTRRLTTFAAACIALAASSVFAAPAKVEVKKTGGTNYQLVKDGVTFFIQGAGGDASKKFLKESGGNSFRTWGADDIDAQLDEAQKLGLTVTVGMWLGHERHGFDYNNARAVRDQRDRCLAAVEKYKDHPAVLMWAIGNEMEGFGAGDNEMIYEAIEDIASRIKQIDPNHPTMSVFAEIGGKRIELFNKICKSVDIMGINSYGGGPSISERYRKEGGVKPYIVTEYGPAGTWEVGKNEWDAPQEQTSTAKADAYRATYEKSISGEKDKLCLGSYVFAWGNKQEATATWYGLFMPDGERLEAIDTMTELWSGKKPTNRCPQIQPLKVEGANRVKPGETIKVAVDVKDPENDSLKIEWRLTKDYGEYQTGGDTQIAPPSFPEAIVENGKTNVELKMPADGGGYWLYAIVHDGNNGAAVANVPLYVDGPVTAPKAVSANLPLVINGDGEKTAFIPSGWMGKTDAIGMDEKFTINPHSGATCMKFEFRSPDNFGGIVWQDPANDWGDAAGGYNLTGAKKLSFWARGENGGEKVEFKFGVIGKEKKFHDSDGGGIPPVELTKEWKQYEIDVTGKDLSRVKTGFVWTLAGQGKPVIFYLDDIRFE